MPKPLNYLFADNLRGLLLVLSGPAGSGKTTVAEALVKRFGDKICRVVTATTRAPRVGERDGVDYFFMTPEKFKQGLADDAFVEYNIFNQNYYGTPRAELERLLAQKKIVILVIDVNGADAVRKFYPSCLRLFVIPPSGELLRQRLQRRRTESAAEVEARLRIAEQEISRLEDYDYLVVNDDLELAIADTLSIIRIGCFHHIRGGELAAWHHDHYRDWHARVKMA